MISFSTEAITRRMMISAATNWPMFISWLSTRAPPMTSSPAVTITLKEIIWMTCTTRIRK